MGLMEEALRASPWADLFEQRGRQLEALRMLTIFLESRFGDVPEALTVTLGSLSVEQLEELADVCFDASSLDEFIAAIPQSNCQLGGGDYLKLKDRLFAGETVDSLYEKIKDYQDSDFGGD